MARFDLEGYVPLRRREWLPVPQLQVPQQPVIGLKDLIGSLGQGIAGGIGAQAKMEAELQRNVLETAQKVREKEQEYSEALRRSFIAAGVKPVWNEEKKTWEPGEPLIPKEQDEWQVLQDWAYNRKTGEWRRVRTPSNAYSELSRLVDEARLASEITNLEVQKNKILNDYTTNVQSRLHSPKIPRVGSLLVGDIPNRVIAILNAVAADQMTRDYAEEEIARLVVGLEGAGGPIKKTSLFGTTKYQIPSSTYPGRMETINEKEMKILRTRFGEWLDSELKLAESARQSIKRLDEERARLQMKLGTSGLSTVSAEYINKLAELLENQGSIEIIDKKTP